MTIYVTGGSGFLGRELLQRAKDRELCALTSQEALLSDPRYMHNDAFFSLTEVPSDSLLIHAAFTRGSEREKVESSIAFFHKTMQKAEELGIRRIINISSQSVYDPFRSAPADEHFPYLPSSLYGVAKAYTEAWRYPREMDVIHLRLASLVGPDFPKRITSRLLRDALEKGKMEVEENGAIFSYLHVCDCAEAILTMVDRDFCELADVYNVGSEESYTVTQIGEAILRLVPEAVLSVIPGSGKAANNSVNIDRLKRDFSFQPKWNLNRILSEELERRTNG